MKFRGLLLGVICGVCKYSGIESSFNPIEAFDDNAMFPGFQKIVIEQNFPLFMQKFTVAMC